MAAVNLHNREHDPTELIKAADTVRDKLLQIGTPTNDLGLPNIVVIGNQSAGKSLLIENIIGHGPLLPSKEGMATMCPVEIRLYKNPGGEMKITVASTVLVRGRDGKLDAPALEQKSFVTFQDAKRHIDEINDRLSQARTVSDDPIVVTITAPDVTPLSLVDLPGFVGNTGVRTNNPLPASEKEKIVTMARKYVRNKDAIILAVVDMSADYKNAMSVGIAGEREADEHGLRTMLVVTKADLYALKKGDSDYRALLVPPERSAVSQGNKTALGCIPVISAFPNASPSQTPQERRVAEVKYFSTTEPFQHYTNAEYGITYLHKTLSNILAKRIAAKFRSLETTLGIKLASLAQELARMKPATPKTPDELSRLTSVFVNEMARRLQGAGNTPNPAMLLPAGEPSDIGQRIALTGGAKLYHHLHETFPNAVDAENKRGFDELEVNLAARVRNASGEGQGYGGIDPVTVLVGQRVGDFVRPARECVTFASKHLVEMAQEVVEKSDVIARFRDLGPALVTSIQAAVMRQEEPVWDAIQMLLNVTARYTDLNNPDCLNDELASQVVRDVAWLHGYEFNDRKELVKSTKPLPKAAAATPRCMRCGRPVLTVAEYNSHLVLCTRYPYPTYTETAPEARSLFSLRGWWPKSKGKDGHKDDGAAQAFEAVSFQDRVVRVQVESQTMFIKKVILDVVPKLITYHMTEPIKNRVIADRIADYIKQTSDLEKLLAEDPALEVEREKRRTLQQTHQDILELVHNVMKPKH